MWSSSKDHDFVVVPNPAKKVNIWATISTDGELRFEFLEGIQTAKTYKERLKRHLSLMNLHEAYFQQDGSSIHTANLVIKHLNKHYRNHWIGLKSPRRQWPARSPDLTPCDFYLWPRIKFLVKEHNPQNREESIKAITMSFHSLPQEETGNA